MATVLRSLVRFHSRIFRISHLRLAKKTNSLCLVVRKPLLSTNNNSLLYNCHAKLFHSTTSNKGDIVPFNLSDVGEGINEVVIKEWFVKVGDQVNQFDNICEVQSDKASVTITSRYDGIIHKIYYEVDDIAKVGLPLIDVEVESSSSDEEEVDIHDHYGHSEDDNKISPSSSFGKVLAAPSVRRMAKEHNLNLGEIQGSGKEGRVLKEDMLIYLENKKSKPTPASYESPKQAQPIPKPKISIPRPAPVLESKTEKIKGIQRIMVQTMTKSLQIPHFTYSDEVNMSKLAALRPHMKKLSSVTGINITYMPFFIKAASLALTEYPILNATIDDKCENITYHSTHNISLAMDTPNGLIVPNIKDVQSLTIIEIAEELNRLQSLGSEGKLKTSDLTGGTLTLSNIGSIGGTFMKPIIMAPSLAIGALGKMQVKPIIDEEDKVTKASILSVSWSADHRVIDGATMARYSNLWKSYVEEPSLMMIYMK